MKSTAKQAVAAAKIASEIQKSFGVETIAIHASPVDCELHIEPPPMAFAAAMLGERQQGVKSSGRFTHWRSAFRGAVITWITEDSK